jgi:two-component system, OmpR family, response regulator CpxR
MGKSSAVGVAPKAGRSDITAMPRILIADDDRELCALLSSYLHREGFEVDVVHDGEAALVRLRDGALRPDLLILDVMMPGTDGLATLREVRQQHRLPVIMLSARGEPVDRVVGLELGADDYLSKPCLPRELLARVRAQLRRQALPAAEELNLGLLHLHPAERRAAVEGQELRLTGAEFALLLTLAQHAGEVVNKAVLTRLALGREIERFDRSVDVHVSRLRRKLSDASPHAPAIEAVRGAGYLLVAPRV